MKWWVSKMPIRIINKLVTIKNKSFKMGPKIVREQKRHCTLYNDGLLKPQTKGGEKVTTKARQILITNYMPRGS